MPTLSVNSRSVTGTGLNKLRRQGILPGVVYGHGVAPLNIGVDKIAFTKVYRQTGESSLLDLVINSGKPVKVLIQEVQYHPRTEQPVHVDFHQVRMDERLTAEIPLKFIGEPRAVKELGGVLLKNLDHLKVECLPSDLVHEIEVDVTELAVLEQSLHVKDISLPPGLKLLTALDDIVTTVAAPRTEAELEQIKSEVKEDVSQVEKVEAEKETNEEASTDSKKS